METTPFGRKTALLAKLYFGALTSKLSGFEIERNFYLLILIEEGDGKLTQQCLAQKYCCDKVTMVRLIDYLSGFGLIERKQNIQDRREYFLSVTEKGMKLIPQIRKAFRELEEQIFNGFSQIEKENLLKGLDKIRVNLSELPVSEVKINYQKIKKK